jgi:alpha-galactosidase
MAVVFDSVHKVFSLVASDCSYVLQVGGTGHLLHRHWGGGISDRCLPPEGTRDARQAELPSQAGPGLADDPSVSLNLLRLEYPVGWGDFRTPAIEVVHADGSRNLDLRYERHAILSGKPELKGLPGSYAQTQAEADTLIITLRDKLSGIEVDLSYTAFADFSVIARRSIIRNLGAAPVTIVSAASGSVDFPTEARDVITCSGSWQREFRIDRSPVRPGVTAIGSRRGISSAEHPPHILLAEPNTGESHGRVHGMLLLWSGNHRQAVERDSQGVDRLQSGLADFSWQLEPGEEFSTPEALLITSGEGLGGFSRTCHRILRTRVVRGPWRDRARPVIVNSWEGYAFDFDADRLEKLAVSGADLGCELLVVDDGWFGTRNDDRSGLGDWTVNQRKLPGGLAPLAERVNRAGLKLGLWIEPEMVNPDSELYRRHPDWCLAVPGRARLESRHQLVLDLGRDEVRDAICEQLFAVLDSAPIEYIKWDMNRPLDVQWSAALPADRQGEAAIRYTLGLYAMLDAIRNRYPSLLIESCASGAARFDAGMLAWCPQMWVSDNTDAHHRLAIQQGASLIFPLSCQVALVNAGDARRQIPMSTRCAVAATGATGFICDIQKLNEQDRAIARAEIANYKNWRHIILTGNLYRLGDDDEKVGWMVVAQDRKLALMTVVSRLVVPHKTQTNIRLAGLDPRVRYRLTEANPHGDAGSPSPLIGIFHGDTLMECGVRASLRMDWDTTRFWLEQDGG